METKVRDGLQKIVSPEPSNRNFANSKLRILGGSVWSHRRFSHLEDRR